MKTVLLIDDDERFRKGFAAQMLQAGWLVIEAADGREGLRLAMAKLPDLVLCDLLASGVNGFQFCHALGELPTESRNIRTIVTSTSAYAADRLNVLEAGAAGYLVKPFEPCDVARVLAAGDPALSSSFSTAVSAPLPSALLVEKGPPSPSFVRFWGVRGSVPCPGAATVFYGGNTSCVEICAAGERVILDAGTGIRPLGLRLVEEFQGRPLAATILISHTHWDHIQGFPFFAPAYQPCNRIRILGFEGARRGLDAILIHQMESPYFPVPLRQLPGNITIEELKQLSFGIGAIQVDSMPLNHPGICAGFRLNIGSASVAYLPDNELQERLRETLGRDALTSLERVSNQDRKVIEFVRGVDILIIDSQYDSLEYQAHTGWGHGCVDDVVALALLAEVKQLYLFHHDPTHDDEKIASMVDWARKLVSAHHRPLRIEAAREGLECPLPLPTAQVQYP